MKRAGKILRIGLPVLLLAIIAGITLTIGWRPFIGPRKRATTDRKFERTPERLARGRYLTLGVLGCENCHSSKDWIRHGAPMITGMEFAGQSWMDWSKGSPVSQLFRTSLPIPKPERVTGPMTNFHGLFAKASSTMAALFFP